MEDRITLIFNAILQGNLNAVTENVQFMINGYTSPEKILQQAMIPAMGKVGDLFEQGEYYIPEMLVSARAMQAGLKILKPHLVEKNIQSAGKVVIGTVKGDLHDIGKNLVAIMLEGAGFQVIDLGSDVLPEKFVETVKQEKPKIIAMSALLTTTMLSMGETVKILEASGFRDQVKVIIGGAPITSKYAEQIGADGFAIDAGQAVKEVKRLLEIS